MRFAHRILVIFLAIVICLRVPTWHVDACCPAYRDMANIQIADQKILIAWNPSTQMEHFIREAGFKRSPAIAARRPHAAADAASPADLDSAKDKDDDFGFLVPSPTQPTIEASEGLVFNRLNDAIAPKVVHKSKWQVMPILAVFAPLLLLEREMPVTADASKFPASAVDVLETKQVAGYDVSVLRADDATALSQWLSSNGYTSRPGLKEWAEPYVAAGWIITAFKYSAQSSSRVDASAIRISFKTDRPIFPYRVPTDQITKPGDGHLLRTYVVGPGRAGGTLSDLTPGGETVNSTPWQQGRVRYAMPVRGEQLTELLADALPPAELSQYQSSWLTAFDDRTWPSSTQDLWFDFDSQAQPYQETRVVTRLRSVMLPLDLFAALAVLIVWRRRRVAQ